MQIRFRKLILAIVAIAILSPLSFLKAAFGDAGSNDILSVQERRWLSENTAHIVLAIEENYPPFVFINENQSVDGLAHEYISLVQKKLGVQFQQRRYSSLKDIFDAVRTGDVHIVNAVTNTAERSEFLSFTEPFISVPNVILVRSNQSRILQESALSGLNVSLVKDYAVTNYLIKKVPGVRADLVSNDLTAMLNVSFGISDAAVTDLATASYWIAKKGITNLRHSSEAGLEIRLSIAATQKMQMLAGILQKGLNAIDHSERKKIHASWMSLGTHEMFSNPLYKTIAIAFAGLILLTVTLIGLWNSMLRKQVSIQTAKLNRELLERTSIEQQLRNMQHRLEVACASVSLGIWDWLVPENKLWWDPQMYFMYGISQNEHPLKYGDWYQSLHPDDAEAVSKALNAALRGEAEYKVEFRIIQPNHQVRHIQGTGLVVRNPDGSPFRVIGANLDITERKFAEDELKLAKQTVEKAYRVKSDFLATMSHELRTPLNPLIGFTELLSESPNLTEEQRQWLNIMLQRADDLTKLIEEVLDLSRIEEQKLTLNPESWDLYELIESMTTSFVPIVNKKGISIWSHRENDVPQQICADGQRLRQIILNLIGNAVKFTAKGSITLSVELDKTGRTTRPAEKHEVALLFCVRDTGIGIPENKQSVIFDWFTQADISHAAKFGGAGLGLHIASGLVKLMNGSIWVESVPEKGSAFFFSVIVQIAPTSPNAST
jgi:two-component system sensor histidine kinase EvgS